MQIDERARLHRLALIKQRVRGAVDHQVMERREAGPEALLLRLEKAHRLVRRVGHQMRVRDRHDEQAEREAIVALIGLACPDRRFLGQLGHVAHVLERAKAQQRHPAALPVRAGRSAQQLVRLGRRYERLGVAPREE
jgi:hypothetical protein